MYSLTSMFIHPILKLYAEMASFSDRYLKIKNFYKDHITYKEKQDEL
jgi:hypothetical protein